MQRTTPRRITGAPSRGAGWDEAAGVYMRLPSVPTARALMGCGPMPVQPRRRSASSRRGGDPLPARAGRRGPRSLRHPSTRPRSPRGRMWARRRSKRGRKEDWLRLPWRRESEVGGSCFLFSLCLFCFWCAFSFPLFGGGGKEIRAPQYDFCIVGDRVRTLCLKAGKWARCHSPSDCMQWDSKYETYTHTNHKHTPCWRASPPPPSTI